MPHARSVSASFYVGAGNRYEDEESAGLSHYLEHILFKGTRRYPTAKRVSETIEGVGGILNAATDREATVYFAKVPKAHLRIAVDLLTDMLRAPLMEPVEFEKERGVILEELAMTEDSPPEQAARLLEAILFPDQPLGWDIGGTPENVMKLTRDQAIAYMARQYVPNNVVFAAAGDLQHEAVVEQLNDLTADWPAGDPIAWYPAAEGHAGPVVGIKTKSTEQAHISMAMPGYSLHDPRRHALDLLCTLLGEGMSSRLFTEIREVRGLAYDVHSYVEHYLDAGAFGVQAGVDPKNAVEAIRAIVGELAKVRDEAIPEAELEMAKELARGRLELRMEDTRSVSGWIGGQELLLDRVMTPEEIVGYLTAVTTADLATVAGDLVRRDRLHLAIVGPYRGGRKFEALLAI